jgi:hypothetical protein
MNKLFVKKGGKKREEKEKRDREGVRIKANEDDIEWKLF